MRRLIYVRGALKIKPLISTDSVLCGVVVQRAPKPKAIFDPSPEDKGEEPPAKKAGSSRGHVCWHAVKHQRTLHADVQPDENLADVSS